MSKESNANNPTSPQRRGEWHARDWEHATEMGLLDGSDFGEGFNPPLERELLADYTSGYNKSKNGEW